MEYYVLLSQIFNPGDIKFNKLLDFFKSAKNIYDATSKDLRESSLLSDIDIVKIQSIKSNFDIKSYMKALADSNIKLVSRFCNNYPALLKNLDNAPNLLYYIGELPNNLCVSIVGSRECSTYGRESAHKLAKDLSLKGVNIVSGMARGIDTEANTGALAGAGYTVAILGCGVNVCYPAENHKLFEEIKTKGCIISEYPPGIKPKPSFFPVRNRIMAGMSAATIVVEATQKSGIFITVNLALSYGREVLAVPGNINTRYSFAPNQLIKDGAGLITNAQDVLDYLGIIEPDKKEVEENMYKTLDNDEKIVYACIIHDNVSIEEIKAKTNMEVNKLQFILTMLEMKKLIKKLPGGSVSKI